MFGQSGNVHTVSVYTQGETQHPKIRGISRDCYLEGYFLVKIFLKKNTSSCPLLTVNSNGDCENNSVNETEFIKIT